MDTTSTFDGKNLGIPLTPRPDGFWVVLTDQGKHDGTDPSYPDDRFIYRWRKIYLTDFNGTVQQYDGVTPYNKSFPSAIPPAISSLGRNDHIINGLLELNHRMDVPIGSIVWAQYGTHDSSQIQLQFVYEGYSPIYGEVVGYAPGKVKFFDNRYWIRVRQNSSLTKQEVDLLKPDHDLTPQTYIAAENFNEPKRPIVGGWQYSHMVPEGSLVIAFPVFNQTYVNPGGKDLQPVRYVFCWNHPVRYAKVTTVVDCDNVIADETDQAGQSLGLDPVYLTWTMVESGGVPGKKAIMKDVTGAGYAVIRWLATSTANVANSVRQYGVIINPQWRLKVGNIASYYGSPPLPVYQEVNSDVTQIFVGEGLVVSNITDNVDGHLPMGSGCDGPVRMDWAGLPASDCIGNSITLRSLSLTGGLALNPGTGAISLALIADNTDTAWDVTNACRPVMHTLGANCIQDLVTNFSVSPSGNLVTLIRYHDTWTNGLFKFCNQYNNTTVTVPWIIAGDIVGKMNIDQTSPQTMVGTFKFPAAIVESTSGDISTGLTVSDTSALIGLSLTGNTIEGVTVNAGGTATAADQPVYINYASSGLISLGNGGGGVLVGDATTGAGGPPYAFWVEGDSFFDGTATYASIAEFQNVIKMTSHTRGVVVKTTAGSSVAISLGTHDLYILNKTGTFTCNLPAATGSKSCFSFKNIHATGSLVVHPNGTDKIDANNADSTLAQWGLLNLVDAATGQWVIA